jgi:WD40 repeat protein
MRILTVSWDRTARVWDVVTGKPVGVPMQNGRDIYSACFSPDGKYVVTSNGDNTARLWDAATGKELGEPLKHRDKITSALFSPDGTRVVTASNDHTARVWDIVLAGSVCPQWLATLDEFAAGQRFGSHGEIERLGNERQAMRADLRNRAKSLSVNELQCRWLQWFLADPRTRTISPLSDETVPEYIQRRVKENTTDSLREAIELDPNNALALARFASHLVEEKNAHQDGLEIYANLYSDLAIKLAPRDAEVLRLRQEVLDTLQKHHW